MTATKGLGTYGNAVGTVTPLDHKMAQLGLVVKTAANTIRAGLFWDGSATIVSGKANMSYDVRAFSAVTSRGATAGAVLLTNDAVLNLSTDVTGAALVAPGSNSRYHLVFAWQREFTLDGTDSNPVIGVLQGTAAASPTVPSLAAYPGAIELARILVPAGVTATNSGTTITQTAPFTATSGGTVVVRTTTERDAGSWAEGQRVYDIATDLEWVYTGSTWLNVAHARLQMDTTNSTIVTRTQIGMGKITGNSTAAISESVTFPTAFKTSTVPVVVANYIGNRATGSFNAVSLTVGGGIATGAGAPSNTGFTVGLNLPSGAFSNTIDFYYSWIAIGELA